MSHRHFNGTDNAELRAKIDKAKRRLPLPELLAKLGLGEHARKSACCPWHDDQHQSFSVFQGKDGLWRYKCFVCDARGGDEIALLVKHLNVSGREAIRRYLEMAGFSSHRRKSHEYPKPPESPRSHEYPVYPVSNGQGLEKELKALAVRNACIERSTARNRRWQLVRDLRAVEVRLRRELDTAELILTFNEWHRLSHPFLDPAKTRDDYLAAFLAELRKVRVPTGEGDTIKKAREAVLKLSDSELPVIPGMPDAPESCRRLAALHRELSRLAANGTYFLSYRDAAKVCDGLSHQFAHTITFALARLGVIKIVRKGRARLNGGKAAEFRYLLSQTENGAEDDEGFDL
jgi:CHC2 zinc finger